MYIEETVSEETFVATEQTRSQALYREGITCFARQTLLLFNDLL